jgi:hypothetical protein
MVVHLDVRDHRDLGSEAQEAAVALVGLGDHPLPRAPTRVCRVAVLPRPGQLATEEPGRIGPGGAQRPDQHRGGSRLAMGAGDRDQPLLRTELGQQLAAVEDALAALAGEGQLRVVLGHRGRDDDLGVLRQLLCVVSHRGR